MGYWKVTQRYFDSGLIQSFIEKDNEYCESIFEIKQDYDLYLDWFKIKKNALALHKGSLQK